jgi:hypothetical protein
VQPCRSACGLQVCIIGTVSMAEVKVMRARADGPREVIDEC